ncbi:hypothetical protein RI129_009367 [Pyrocoelia pectoralis]|uniref:Peptidase S1 domain-containing protein n=1 Tax=Pyrocoelia pectoralis TaxID=417401 RepID=A0AAN7ZC60_9COLE
MRLLLLVSFLIYWGDVFASPLNLGSDKRIANGMISPTGEYPFIASYQYHGDHFCGSVLITGNWVLTAAHCVITARNFSNPAFLTVVAGITELNTASSFMQSKTVLRQYAHRYFQGGIDPYDIGLIRVDSPFQISTYVNFINLPAPQQEFFGVVEIVGWGFVRSTYPVVSQQLRMAQVQIISTNACNGLANPYGARVYDIQICVVGYRLRNETTCDGDSGGPLVSYDAQLNPRLIGIMSWNFQPCGMRQSPSVATKLSAFIQWISCQIANDQRPGVIC